MLLGMGGSSLCPEVFRRTFGKIPGYPEMHARQHRSGDGAGFRIGSRSAAHARRRRQQSGTTIEPLMFYKYFINEMRKLKGDRAGENCMAITDPGTLMEAMATGDKFRRIFSNPVGIGGRYSRSYFWDAPGGAAGTRYQNAA